MHLENLFLNPAYLAAFLFEFKVSAHSIWTVKFNSLFKQGCLKFYKSVGNPLNIGQDNC